MLLGHTWRFILLLLSSHTVCAFVYRENVLSSRGDMNACMNSQPDVVIIGGGVIRVCSAYYLAKQRIQVTLIEKGEIASGCSYGNGRLIVPSHSVPLASPGALGSGLRG